MIGVSMRQRSDRGLLSATLVVILLMGAFFVVPTGTASAAQDGDFTYTTGGDPIVATVTDYTGAGGSINIPTTLGGYPTVAIGDYAFSTPNYPLTSVTVPDSVTSIGIYAFANCNAMSSVHLGSGLTTIGHHAFYDCHDLSSLTIPDSVISIGLGAFYNCALMTSVTIGNSVTTIDAGAFINCLSLSSLTIPDSVTTIGFMAFYRCNALVQVDIGNSVAAIGYMAFSNCTSLATVTVPDSTTSIGYDAFSDCPSLAAVTVGSGVTSIGYEAFRNCTGLTSISFRGLVAPSVGTDWILDTPAGIRGHAYAASDFPTPGNEFNGLMMGEVLSPTPSAPVGPIAIRGNAQVMLTWSIPADSGTSAITSYYIYRSTTETGTYILMGSTSGLSYIDSGLTNGQTYWYNISAVNAAGEGEKTTLVSSTPCTVPNAPIICQTVNGSSYANLTWNSNGNGGSAITGYRLYRSNASDGEFILIASPSAPSYHDAALTTGQTYWYKVSAVNAAGESANSSAFSALVPLPVTPSGDATLLLVAAVITIGIALVAVLMLMRRGKK